MGRASNRVTKTTRIEKVYEPTNILRWNKGVLEQKFKEINTGEGIWRNIPDKSEFSDGE